MELDLEALTCSTDGKEIYGTVAAIADPENGTNWEEKGDVQLYDSSLGFKFMLLHPKCLHDLLDEVLRQEQGATLMLSLGPIEDVRQALEM